MVMAESVPPKKTHLLIRGAYDKPGEEVRPGVPELLPPLPAGASNNRLGLARWLVAPENPLTARVAVNRLWETIFGTGLVKTSEDFGLQGEWPSHSELLDWLATEFVRNGWDVKATLKLIVTSAAYRQSSAATPALLQRDPENRLLARGPRQRLSAEAIRDNALLAAGLLHEKLGGPSVKPYQPDGLWAEITMQDSDYIQAKGPDLYRRSLYTFWKRTVAPPMLSNFDAANREACVVRDLAYQHSAAGAESDERRDVPGGCQTSRRSAPSNRRPIRMRGYLRCSAWLPRAARSRPNWTFCARVFATISITSRQTKRARKSIWTRVTRSRTRRSTHVT